MTKEVELQGVPIFSPEVQVYYVLEGTRLDDPILDFEADQCGARRFWPDMGEEPDREVVKAELDAALVAEGFTPTEFAYQREPSMRGWYFYAWGKR